LIKAGSKEGRSKLISFIEASLRKAGSSSILREEKGTCFGAEVSTFVRKAILRNGWAHGTKEK
jgi:hypothetical protein